MTLVQTFAISLPVSPVLAYLVLAALVGSESSGIPVPGETALITASLLAHDGRLKIPVVIAIAAAAAMVGDNIGYLIGRRLGRPALERPGRFEEQRRAALERGDAFFSRHGAKAVFLGRWIAGLRVWASWMAGITRLPWPVFLLWNALGGICWATTVGLAAYFAGRGAEKLIQRIGLGAAIAVGVGVVLLVVVLVVRRRRRRGGSGPATDDSGSEGRIE